MTFGPLRRASCTTLLVALAVISPAAAADRGLTAAELMRGMGLATGAGAVLLLALVEFLWRRQLERATYRWLLFTGLFVLPAMTVLGVTTTLFEETKTVASCNSCHVMRPFVNDLMSHSSATLAARHFRNKWIPEHHCYACHTTYGVHGTLAGKRDGFRHWLLYVSGTWKEPIRYSGSYPNSNCIACHQGTSKFERVNSHHALKTDLATNRVGCVTCHGPAHPTSQERLAARKRP